MNLIRIIMMTCFFISYSLGNIAESAQRIDKVAVQPTTKLGLAFPGGNPKYYSLMSDVGIGVVRLTVDWKHVNKREGKFNFRGLDKKVIRVQKLGMEPFPLVA